jgi:hypothetical protein
MTTRATDGAKSFTSWKLDLLDCIHADPRLKHADKSVAYSIAQHLNAKTRLAFVGAETISDKTCVGLRDVRRAVKRLKDTGWLETRKTQTANVYQFNNKNVNTMLDRLILQKEARDIKRHKKRSASARTQESQQNASARTQESSPARTRESPVHLRGTPYRLSAFRESVIEGRRYSPSAIAISS